MTATRMEATPAIIDMLDSCRAELELLRADCMSPLAYELRDWKSKIHVCIETLYMN